MSSATLQDDPSVDSFFNVVETETLALFEYLFFEFLEEFDVFARAETGRTRDHEPPELMRGFLHCYYKDIYGIRPVERELRNTVVWLSCGFDRSPSRDAVDRFLTDLEHVVDEVFDRLVEQAARRGLLDLTYCIDSTDVRAMPADQDASKCYDPTDDEYYHGYRCTIVSTGQKIPIAAEFTESKQAPEETAPDVAGFVRALFTGEILTEATLSRMQTFVHAPDEDVTTQRGYGLGVRNLMIDDRSLVGHNGTIPGYSAIAMHHDDPEYTIVVLSNLSTIDQTGVFARLQDAVLNGFY